MSIAHDSLHVHAGPHGSLPLHFHHEAANDAARVVTLDTLVAQHGAPSTGHRVVAFAGYDPVASLALGQKVATERILRVVPGFVQRAAQAWAALSPAQRERVVGFRPVLFTVLLDEAATLRALNERYDRAAKSDALSRAQAVTNATESERDARDLYGRVRATVGEYTTAAQWAALGFDTLPESPADADQLAQALGTLATQVGAWHATLDPEVREACEEINLGEALVASLREAAEAVRRTQAEAAGFTAQTRVTQRQLDVQDGRVLHMVRRVFNAFRRAARRDDSVVVPDLDELTNVFVRDRRAKASDDAGEEKAEPEGDAPPATPTPPVPG
jgi:hypothetical protein